MRIGNGYDVHLLADGLPLFLGGVRIDHTKGCVAHSDGDVIIHALCDALLGSLSLGDIGKHFPDTSDEFKNIDSKILLERCYKMVLQRGYFLVNADITLLLQKPKIAKYIPLMLNALEQIFEKCEVEFGVDRSDSDIRVSVKATTTEGAGYIGREEGVAAIASLIVDKRVQ